MRILHVNKFLYRRGGAEAYMLDLAALQRGQSNEVEFFSTRHPENLPATYDRLFPEYLELGVQRDLSTSQKLVAGGRFFHSGVAARAMDQVLDEFQPDVVHLHNIYHQLSPSILRPIAARGIPSVMTLHDYKLMCPTYQFLANGEICERCLHGNFLHAVLQRCQNGSLAGSALLAAESTLHRRLGSYSSVGLFISPSTFLLQRMVEAQVFPARLRQLNHFVETEPRFSRESGGRFLYAGRLSPEKGVDTLVRAVALGGEQIGLDVAGDGPERGRLENLARELAPGRIRFLGRLPKEAVQARMAAAVAVVVPSRWYENQPITVLEAMAQGAPVIASALGGLPELIRDRESGLLVPADDPPALAAALGQLHDSAPLQLTMSQAARRLAETYAPRDHLGALRALYEEAAARARVGVPA